MERRGTKRTKKRLNCALVIDGKRLSGIVLDLSATGLFVQTSANPSPGAEIGLEVDVPGEQQRLTLVVRVARRKVVPPRLRSVAHAGLGLQLQSAPAAYFGYVAQLQPGDAAGASAAGSATASRGASPSPPDPGHERFRVRVSQISGSRSRSLEVTAASEEDARSEALAASGEGWKILACERVA